MDQQIYIPSTRVPEFRVLSLSTTLRLKKSVPFKSDNNEGYLPYLTGKQLYSLSPQIGLTTAVMVVLSTSLLLFGSLFFAAGRESQMPDGGILKQYVLSIWLAFSTLTSIGYGDYTPQSTCSRIVALGAAISGLLFPVAVAWLARKQEERIDHYLSHKIYLFSEVEVFFPHMESLPKSLNRSVLKEILLWLFGLRNNCFIGTYEDLAQLRKKLWFGLSIFTRVVPMAGAVSKQIATQVKHSPVSTKRTSFLETNRVLVYDTLYLVKKRSFTKVILISVTLIMGMLLFFLLGGLGYYLCEEGSNPLIAASPLEGLTDGVYLTAISVMTVGYGDIAPVTVLGKCWTIVTWSAFQYLIPYLLRWRVQQRRPPSTGQVVHLLVSDEVVSRLEQMEERRPGDYFLIPGHECRDIYGEMGWLKRFQYPLALVHGTIVVAITF